MKLQNLVDNSNLESFCEKVSHLSEQDKFNYEILDKQTEISIKQKTNEIKDLIRQTAKNIITIGKKLSEVKQQLKHGEFRNWLKAEFDWSISSATKFMQVSKQFKNVNFTHFNFSSSALYILAAPSTPESAREHALKLASRGENITYSLAKLVVKQHKSSAIVDTYEANQLYLNQATQLDIQKKTSDLQSTQKSTINENDNGVKIIHIKEKNARDIKNEIKHFEINYINTSIRVEGCPEDLTVLFKRMQNDPQFTEDIFKRSKLQ